MAYTLKKLCAKCLAEFTANSNRQKFCADCRQPARLARQRIYDQNDYDANRDKRLEKSTRYNKSEHGRASQMLRDAVRQGKVKRQPCEECGLPNAHGHHEDYSKPLEVVWLCTKHHAERHLLSEWQRNLRKAGYEGGFLLGELIEACGEMDYAKLSIQRQGKMLWWAGYTRYDVNRIMVEWIEHRYEGSTPEVAVAKLWLALNLK